MDHSTIKGLAHGAPATLEIHGDTLKWRAQIGPQAENIVTTVHDVRFARVIEQRWSVAALVVATLGVLWIIRESVLVGAILLGVAAALSAWRLRTPRAFLVIEVRDHRMILKIDRSAVPAACMLVDRIERAIESGEVPDTPPALP